MTEKCCRLCESELFPSPILTLSGMPQSAQYFPGIDEFEKDNGIDLSIYQCSQCNLVQLIQAPVKYFKEVITATAFSPTTRAIRLKKMNQLVSQFDLKGKNFLELGSGRGEMLDIMEEAGVRAVGIEASSNAVKVAREVGREMIEGYIDDIEVLPDGPFDGFVSFYYLEHLPNPRSVIRKLYKNTTIESVGFVTVPNFLYILKTNSFYEFVSDHLSYFTEQTLRMAFEANGFDVIDCTTINDGNDVAATVKKRTPINISEDYIEVEKLSANFRRLVESYTNNGKKVAVWGAGHRTLALMALSKINGIEYVIDSAKFKQGKYTPVLHFEITPPATLIDKPVDLVIVMVPGIYPSEVLSTLKEMAISVDIAVQKENDIQMFQ